MILLHLDNYFDSAFVARKCDNVYLETSQCLYLHRILKMVVEKIGPEKIVWGSDYPYHHQEIELRKIELAGFSDDQLRMMLGGNLVRILGS
jgi:predicted TIM-barrel fold metal-dependent hydrolase